MTAVIANNLIFWNQISRSICHQWASDSKGQMMNNVNTALRSPAGRGFLFCLLGMVCVTVSFFFLPLYAIPEGFGGGTVTAWQFSMGTINSMLAQGITPGFLLLVSLPYIPLVAAFVLVLLSLAVFQTAKQLYLRFFIGTWVLGSIPIILLIAFLIPLVRVGFWGVVVGNILFFAGYRAMHSYVTSVQNTGRMAS